MCRPVQEEKVAVAKAKDFLESNTYSADDPYTTALSAYTLALLRSPYAPLALRRLNHMAITQGTAPVTALPHCQQHQPQASGSSLVSFWNRVTRHPQWLWEQPTSV